MANEIDWGSILNQVLGLGSNVALGFGGGSTGAVGQGREAAAMADPFASQRGPYQQQLSDLLTNPDSFKTDPGYQFALTQGQQAVERGSNALYGTGRTGSLGPELAKYTEGYAANAFNDRVKQLSLLSGAETGNPGAAGQMLMGGFQGQQNALSEIFRGLGMGGGSPGAGGISGGLGGLLNTLLRGGSGGGSIINNNTGTGIDWNNPLAGWGGSTEDPWYGGNGDLNLGGGNDFNLTDWSLE